MIQGMSVKVKAKSDFLSISNIKPGLWLLLFAVTFIFLLSQIGFAQSDESDEPLFKIEFDKDVLVIPCPKGCAPDAGVPGCSSEAGVSLIARITSDKNATDAADLWYEYLPEKGKITETSAGLKWDLSNVRNGSYWLKVKVNKGFETYEVLNKSVELTNCECTCVQVCAEIKLEADKTTVNENEIVLIRAIQSICFSENVNLRWRVTNGEIVSGQGARILKVRARSAGEGDLKVALEFTQEAEKCRRSPELTLPINAGDEDTQ
jgi:hypothetical protein